MIEHLIFKIIIIIFFNIFFLIDILYRTASSWTGMDNIIS